MKFSQNAYIISKDADQALRESPETVQTPNNNQDSCLYLLFPAW